MIQQFPRIFSDPEYIESHFPDIFHAVKDNRHPLLVQVQRPADIAVQVDQDGKMDFAVPDLKGFLQVVQFVFLVHAGHPFPGPADELHIAGLVPTIFTFRLHFFTDALPKPDTKTCSFVETSVIPTIKLMKYTCVLLFTLIFSTGCNGPVKKDFPTEKEHKKWECSM